MIEEEFSLAPRHKDFTHSLLECVKRQPEVLVVNRATPESRTLYKQHRQVAGDYQRCRAFTRLNISKHGIVYAKIVPEHRIEDMIAEWFLSRFPLFTIVLECRGKTYTLSKDSELSISDKKMSEVVQDLESRHPEHPLLQGLTDFDETAFENIYDANYILQRKNTRLFLKNIPKKYHNLSGLQLERQHFLKTHKLTDFM